MRVALILLAALALSLLVWWLSGGRAFVFLLPLVLGLPLLFRQRRW